MHVPDTIKTAVFIVNAEMSAAFPLAMVFSWSNVRFPMIFVLGSPEPFGAPTSLSINALVGPKFIN